MERLNHPVVIEANALEPVLTFWVPPNNTINEILLLAGIPKNLYPFVVVIINGIEVARDQWDFLEPRDEDIIGLHVIPMGGDSAKGILRMVALIAVAIAIPQLALQIGSLTTTVGGVTTLTTPGIFAVAGATLVASLAINAIIPPPKPATSSQSSAGDSYFINSQSNRARLNEVIPIVYGLHKLYGNLATAPSIFSAGTSSVFTALYDWGLGNLDVWDVRAGDTSISKFGGTIRHLKNVPNHFDPEQPNLGLEPVDLELVNYPTKSSELNVELNKNNDKGQPTTAPNSKSAVLEFTFPGGLVKFDKKGKEQRLAVQFNARMKGPSSNYQWVNLPSGTRGYAGDHFQISGGFLNRDVVKNPNEPASVSLTLDDYSITSGTKIFVRLKFNQPTFFIRPQDDLWFVNAENSNRVPQFDFNETPNPDDYPPEWILNTGDKPAKGVFVINEGREYGFEFLTTGVSDGYYIARTNMENFKDAPPPDGFNFPAGVVNSEQLVVGQQGGDGSVIDPPISDALYSQAPGNETYLRIIQTQAMSRRELTRWTEIPTSATLFYMGKNIVLDVSLVGEYKGQLKLIDDPQESYGGVKTRVVYYALKVAPRNVSSYGIGTAPAFDFNIDYSGDFVTRSSFNISGNKLTPGRVSIVVPFAQEGEYEFEITRSGDHEGYNGDDRFIENCSLTRITSRGYPVDETGGRRGILNLKKKHTMTELQFQASGNVQGNVQQVSAMVRQYLRWHDGTSWRTPEVRPKISSNPSYIVLDILTGYSIQNSTDIPSKLDFDGGWITDAQIDFKAFALFADHCNETVKYLDKYGIEQTRFRYQISSIIASQAPIIETVNNILGMCRAQLIMNQQGQVSVMLDSDKNLDGSKKVARQLFTSQNSWSFSATRNFVDLPHSFNVSFTDPELGYQQGNYDVFRPGYNERNSTIFEDIACFGVTNWHQAAQWGMYQLAQGVMRSEIFNLTVDVESLVVQRGDIVEIQHDAPIIGGTSAVVTDVNGKTVTISEEFGQVQDAGYTVRCSSGDIYNGTCETVGNTVTLDIQRNNIYPGDIIVIGTLDDKLSVTQKYIISEVRPKSDLTAELQMGVFNPDLYTTDQGGFPSYDPNFGQTDQESGYHTVVDLEGFSYLSIDERMPFTIATLTWRCDPLDDSVHRFVIEYLKTGSIEKQFIDSVAATPDAQGNFRAQHKYSNDDQNFGSGIYFVTPLSTLGYFGKSDQVYLGKVYDRTVPHNPAPFYVDRLSTDAMRFRWTPSYRDNDIAGYVIYKMPPGTSRFDVGVAEVYQQIDDKRTHSWEDILVEGVFWIVSVDTSGNESEAIAESVYWELIQKICGDPSWPDEKLNCQRVLEELVIDNNVPVTSYAGKSGRFAFYTYQELSELPVISNFAARSYIETTTNLDTIVLADDEWDPMKDIDPMSWQPNGINYEVWHEVSVDGGGWQRFHNELFRGEQLRYRLVLGSYKDDQDLRVQRACIYVHTTNNVLVDNKSFTEIEVNDDE